MTHGPHPTADANLLEDIRRRARQEGLSGPAVVSARPAPGAAEALGKWLEAGHHGEMQYMARLGTGRAEPRNWAPWARSLALFADAYDSGKPCPLDPSRGAISRYARGADYHEVLKSKLSRLCASLQDHGHRARPFVDSSPLMEKALAAAGGLGWIGKNGNLLQERGSFFFIGGVATDAVWAPTPPVEDQCGTCDLCRTSCPTGAIVSPGMIDARLCISYLTIELKADIPVPLRPLLGNRVFGCDDCQDVCPWNRPASHPPDPAYRTRPAHDGPSLLELACLSEEEFRSRFRHTAVRRARWVGLLRNVMVALGNWGSPEAIPTLRRRLEHPAPMVRRHAAWALGRIREPAAKAALEARQQAESDASVARALAAALQDGAPPPGETTAPRWKA
ncbi:MAG: tRNA epoxyqueuosine(34) reductase QueG [Acidobacteriota bacterium]